MEAAYHLSRGRILLAEQQMRVAGMIGDAEGVWLAKQFLARLEECVTTFEGHLRLLEKEAAEMQS